MATPALAAAVLVAAAGGTEDLDRHLAVELGVVGRIDDAHRTGA